MSCLTSAINQILYSAVIYDYHPIGSEANTSQAFSSLFWALWSRSRAPTIDRWITDSWSYGRHIESGKRRWLDGWKMFFD